MTYFVSGVTCKTLINHSINQCSVHWPRGERRRVCVCLLVCWVWRRGRHVATRRVASVGRGVTRSLPYGGWARHLERGRDYATLHRHRCAVRRLQQQPSIAISRRRQVYTGCGRKTPYHWPLRQIDRYTVVFSRGS